MMILNMMKKNIYLIKEVEEPHQKVHQGKNKEVIKRNLRRVTARTEIKTKEIRIKKQRLKEKRNHLHQPQ